MRAQLAAPAAGATPGGDAANAVALTRAWLRRAVVGLNLCPFARAAQAQDRIRFVACDAEAPEALLGALVDELQRLAGADLVDIETTLLIHPRVLTDFDDYNDFLDVVDAALVQLDLEGVIQIASFHPDYRFAGSADDDIANATNRSPFPMLHLLREESVARAVAAVPDTDAIFEANIRTLEALGAEGWAQLEAQCRIDAEADSSTR